MLKLRHVKTVEEPGGTFRLRFIMSEADLTRADAKALGVAGESSGLAQDEAERMATALDEALTDREQGKAKKKR